MSYANAIIGLGVGIAAVILIIAIACYVIFSYAHMKALKALGYDKAWLAWIPYGCTFACADAAAKDEDPVELFGSFTVPALLFKLWWILLLVLGFLPFPGWLSNVLNIALNIVLDNHLNVNCILFLNLSLWTVLHLVIDWLIARNRQKRESAFDKRF